MGLRVSHPDQPGVLSVLVIFLALAGLLVFVPMWAPLAFAAWFAVLARPILARFTRWLGGRGRASVVLVLLLLVLVFAPLAIVVVSLTSSGIDLVKRVLDSKGGGSALRAIVQQSADGSLGLGDALRTPEKLMNVAQQYGGRAWTTLSRLAGVTASAIIGLFVFFLAAYEFMVEGNSAAHWLKRHAPIKPEHFDRLADAFHETGRGLLIGVALTGAVQASVATIAYFVLKVPSALVLGMLTFLASLIPSVGTALVWGPVALGLVLSGRTAAGVGLAIYGFVVVGLIDNVLRPIFSRYGRLDLPSFVILVSMFGGLALFGGLGLVLGPLLVRLGVEALRIAREERMTGAHTTMSPPKPASEDANGNGDVVDRGSRPSVTA